MFCEDLFRNIADSKASGEKIEFEVSTRFSQFKYSVLTYCNLLNSSPLSLHGCRSFYAFFLKGTIQHVGDL